MTTLNPSYDTISQLSHAAWGYLLVTFPVLLFHIPLVWTASIVVIGAGIKEYWDCHGLEAPIVAGNSWRDFAFWCVGIVVAVLTMTIKI